MDGKGSIESPSVMSTSGGLELENLINPELTWKAVAKGYRSSSRRTRKHAPRNFTAGQEGSLQESRKVEEGTASDTEKHVVAILGRRFSNKIEDIPLKKRRRFLVRSPSPPPPVSRNEDPEPDSQLKSESEAGDLDSTKGDPQQKSEDFSGLDILAAGASNNMTGQVDHAQTVSVVRTTGDQAPCIENDSSPNGTACEELVKGSSMEKETGDQAALESPFVENDSFACEEVVKGSSMEKESGDQAALEAPSVENNSSASEEVVKGSSMEKETGDQAALEAPFVENDSSACEEVVKGSSMEKETGDQAALEAPFVENDSSPNGTAGEEVVKGSSMENETGDGLPNSHPKEENVSVKGSGFVPEARMHWDLNVPADAWESPNDSLMIDSNVGPPPIGLPTGTEAMIEAPHHSEEVLECKQIQDSLVSLMSKEARKLSSSGIDDADDTHNVFKNSEVLELSACIGARNIDPPIGLQTGTEDHSEGVKCKQIQDSLVSIMSTEARKQLSSGTDDADNTHNMFKNSEVRRDLFSTPNDLFASVGADLKGSCKMVASPTCSNTKEGIKLLSSDGTLAKSFVPPIDQLKTLSSASITTGDPSDDSYGSGVYQTEKVVGVNFAGTGRKEEPIKDGGYGSQFEDGELRESDPCQYYEGEVGEVEQVDYGSECDEGLPLAYDKEVEAERLSLSTPRSSNTVKNSEEQNDDMDIAADDSVSVKNQAALDEPLEKGLPSGFVGTRAPRGEFASYRPPPDGFWRKNAYPARRSNHFGNVSPRDERDVHPKRFFGGNRGDVPHMRGNGRSPGRSGYWNDERRYSPNRGAGYGYGRARPTGIVDEGRRYNMMDSKGERFVGFENRVSRQPLVRRRSPPPGNRNDDSYGPNPRMFPMREMSPHPPARNQFRRFPNPREEFRNFPEDDDATEFPIRRDRSMSPLSRGHPQYSMAGYRRPSRSPSTRSRAGMHSPPPPPCYLQRRDDMHSRSPDPRSGAAAGMNSHRAVRMPFQKRFTTARYEDRFTSPTRRQFGPNHVRSFDDHHRGNDGLVNFRGRKSPVRMYHHQQQGNNNNNNNRFDSMRPMGNDDDFRPVMQQQQQYRRFRNEGDFEDRNKGRFEMSRPRRYDTDEPPNRQFRCNEDSAVDNNNNNNRFDSMRSMGNDDNFRPVMQQQQQYRRFRNDGDFAHGGGDRNKGGRFEMSRPRRYDTDEPQTQLPTRQFRCNAEDSAGAGDAKFVDANEPVARQLRCNVDDSAAGPNDAKPDDNNLLASNGTPAEASAAVASHCS
ncbi:hypothetical protein LINGRAHAP2_LOCUS17166 [Linum grandiflorum]